MSAEDVSIEKILSTIRRWNLEARNPRNDGWVQLDYKERIKKVFAESASLLKENKT
tara:strand:- start:747 stop:914 length:168 start_codon:yes stop_codon:yes gene_type:complete